MYVIRLERLLFVDCCKLSLTRLYHPPRPGGPVTRLCGVSIAAVIVMLEIELPQFTFQEFEQQFVIVVGFKFLRIIQIKVPHQNGIAL